LSRLLWVGALDLLGSGDTPEGPFLELIIGVESGPDKAVVFLVVGTSGGDGKVGLGSQESSGISQSLVSSSWLESSDNNWRSWSSSTRNDVGQNHGWILDRSDGSSSSIVDPVASVTLVGLGDLSNKSVWFDTLLRPVDEGSSFGNTADSVDSMDDSLVGVGLP